MASHDCKQRELVCDGEQQSRNVGVNESWSCATKGFPVDW
jgi:hypothetical protein